jgi:hypothetical protein
MKGELSMSTSLLYRAFGVKHYDFAGTEFIDGGIIFNVKPKERLLVCLICGSREVTRRGSFSRRLRT